MVLEEYQCGRKDGGSFVLILVFVEYGFRVVAKEQYNQIMLGLNPCFCGVWF